MQVVWGIVLDAGSSAVGVESIVSVEEMGQCVGRAARGRVPVCQLFGVYSWLEGAYQAGSSAAMTSLCVVEVVGKVLASCPRPFIDCSMAYLHACAELGLMSLFRLSCRDGSRRFETTVFLGVWDVWVRQSFQLFAVFRRVAK